MGLETGPRVENGSCEELDGPELSARRGRGHAGLVQAWPLPSVLGLLGRTQPGNKYYSRVGRQRQGTSGDSVCSQEDPSAWVQRRDSIGRGPVREEEIGSKLKQIRIQTLSLTSSYCFRV